MLPRVAIAGENGPLSDEAWKTSKTREQATGGIPKKGRPGWWQLTGGAESIAVLVHLGSDDSPTDESYRYDLEKDVQACMIQLQHNPTGDDADSWLGLRKPSGKGKEVTEDFNMNRLVKGRHLRPFSEPSQRRPLTPSLCYQATTTVRVRAIPLVRIEIHI